MLVGLISDTHGLLRPEAMAALQGVDRILHAGDIGDSGILVELEAIAPVQAVRGNIDHADEWPNVPVAWRGRLENLDVLLIHDLEDLRPELLTPEPDLVVCGHSHKPAHGPRDGLQVLNPGAAGRKRFSLPISVARLRVHGARYEVEFINLLDDRPLP
jgi:putative phosphoesterase